MTTTPDLIDQMRDPAFYPHVLKHPVQVMQTHISFVVLTGEFAYKIKKAVNLGFLDFSTLEKRKFFCEKELRLNKQFAPDLYVAVLPVYLDGERYTLSAPAPDARPVEYALQMKEFAQEDVMLNVFERGELHEDHFIEIGRRLAQIHARASTDDRILSYGDVEAIQGMARENYGIAEKYMGVTQTKERYEETKTFTDDFFRNNKELFKERIAQRKIRECHGDLHLNNICLHEGKIEFFDRIEFNEKFKNIDVMYDLAFLLMDLQFRDHRDLANVLLNTYLERSGDYRGAMLLPLYMCMRAYVRGKVFSILSNDENIDEAERNKAVKEASAYFEHALRYARPGEARLLIMSGISGSGKSTVARELGRRLDAVVIRSDAVRKHLAGIDLLDHNQEIYSPEITIRTYEEMTDLGIDIASSGRCVILDAKFDREELRSRVLSRARKSQVSPRILWCHAPIETIRKRLGAREADISDAKVEMLSDQERRFDAFTDPEHGILTEIVTEDPVDYEAIAGSIR